MLSLRSPRIRRKDQHHCWWRHDNDVNHMVVRSWISIGQYRKLVCRWYTLYRKVWFYIEDTAMFKKTRYIKISTIDFDDTVRVITYKREAKHLFFTYIYTNTDGYWNSRSHTIYRYRQDINIRDIWPSTNFLFCVVTVTVNMAEKSGRIQSVFEISIVPLSIIVISLPLVGFIACVILSLLYDFESSTATHCEVRKSFSDCCNVHSG